MECVSDEHCRLHSGNDEYFKFLGVNQLPDNYLDFIPGDERHYIKGKIQEMLRRRIPTITIHNTVVNGQSFCTRWVDTPVYQKGGTLKWIHSVGFQCALIGGGCISN
jgi:hypothetical protein